jgi:hypothetical protein
MLAVFPELMANYEVFKMKPRIGAGYGERYDKRTVRGYWSRRRPREMGIIADLATANQRATFWEQNDFRTNKSRIKQADFVEVDGEIYKFVEDDGFGAEGGFTKWIVQVSQGNDGKQEPHQRVNLGEDEYK